MAETIQPHLSEADLAFIAVGHAPGTEVSAHLNACPDCRHDLDWTARAVTALSEPVRLHEPPADVWAGIERSLAAPENPDAGPGTSGASASDVTAAASRPAPRHDPGAGPGTPDGPVPGPSHRAGSTAVDLQDGGTVTAIAGRHRWPVVVAAAAAGLVVGAAGAALAAGLLTPRDDDAAPPAEPVAVGEAVLEPVAAQDLEGRAEMVANPDGDLRLTVDVSRPPQQGYFEVWLRDEQASRLISLGTVSDPSTTLPVPEGVDLERFPVVDVSQEDFDGDPSHSGVTLAAGPMVPAGDDAAP